MRTDLDLPTEVFDSGGASTIAAKKLVESGKARSQYEAALKYVAEAGEAGTTCFDVHARGVADGMDWTMHACGGRLSTLRSKGFVRWKRANAQMTIEKRSVGGNLQGVVVLGPNAVAL